MNIAIAKRALLEAIGARIAVGIDTELARLNRGQKRSGFEGDRYLTLDQIFAYTAPS